MRKPSSVCLAGMPAFSTRAMTSSSADWIGYLDGEIQQTERVRRGRGRTFPLPGVQADVVVIAARRDKPHAERAVATPIKSKPIRSW
jgi:hypothetical protein